MKIFLDYFKKYIKVAIIRANIKGYDFFTWGGQ
jgi:hypothetical protein